MIEMKTSRWSLGDSILVAIVVWLGTILLGAVAWNHHWRLPVGFEVPELVLIIIIAFAFLRPSRRRGGDDS